MVTYYTEASGKFPVSAGDYTAVQKASSTVDATTITIPAGQTTPTNPISITTAVDADPEPDETFAH